MEVKISKIILLATIIIFFSCSNNKANGDNNKLVSKKNSDSVIKFSSRTFIINYSNLIYEHENKKITIPIFNGNMGDVTYNDFLEYCYIKKYLNPNTAETSLIIKADRGKLTKTFHEFLMFYKGNILKNSDISKPAKIKVDGGALDIFYDFKVSGVSFVLQVKVGTDKNEIDVDLIKSILDIKLNENVEKPIFQYRFWKNYTSDEF